MMKVNDCVESLKTGKKGIIQASYSNDLFLMFNGDGYEHLLPSEMEIIDKKDVPFRVDLYEF